MNIERTIESELQVIGALLVDPSVSTSINLSADDFVNKRLAKTYEHIAEIIASGDPVDAVTVYEYGVSRGGLSLPELARLSNECITTANTKRHAEIVRSEAVKRQAYAAMREAMENIDQENSVDGLISKLMLLNKPKKKYSFTIKQAMLNALDMFDKQANGMRGVRTGVARLDDQLGGMHDGDLVVVAARPAMGKTAFAINLAVNAGEPVGIFSSEQPNEQIAARMMSIYSGVSVALMRTGLNQSEWDRLQSAQINLASKQIFINDDAGIDIASLARQARAWKFEHNIKAVYVDYLQRIKATIKSENNHEKVAEVAARLKDLARELCIPVISLAQVNRKVEDRTDKRPFMSDIAESGVIEREADQVITLYRDEVYNQNTPEKGVMEINICKNRHGPTGMIKTKWSGACMKVSNYTE